MYEDITNEMPDRDRLSGFMMVQDDGPSLRDSNYWDSLYCQSGLLYFSVNAGAIRMLVPDDVSDELLDALTTTQHVVVSRDAAGVHYELLFEDGTPTPYFVFTTSAAWDHSVPDSESGRINIDFRVYARGCRLLARMEARFRR